MKNVRNSLFGVVVPLVTTFFDDESFDQGAYEKQIEYCIESSVHGLFAMGSTGSEIMSGALVNRAKFEGEQRVKAVVKRMAETQGLRDKC